MKARGSSAKAVIVDAAKKRVTAVGMRSMVFSFLFAWAGGPRRVVHEPTRSSADQLKHDTIMPGFLVQSAEGFALTKSSITRASSRFRQLCCLGLESEVVI